ncbi:MAG: VWA domain-containing protein [Candidatus Latescibacterota bacterium]|nr:MAG: VWA domain-containing protein [Candidatus Latescibacterota bacterium]
MSAVALFALLAVLGLAVDLGRYVVVKAQLSKAVDGGALAGASVLPAGRDRARSAAHEYAQMNFGKGFMSTTDHRFRVHFESDPTQAIVGVKGAAQMPTLFLQLVGIRNVTVVANAEAERRPLSVALVLDNSYSLHPNFTGVNAIGYLRDAAEDFLWYFDEDMDKMALVLFSTGTEVPFSLGHDFRSTITSRVRSMTAIRKTNLGDGFITGRRELENDPDRLAGVQALVFFTDGRPTALRGVFEVNGSNVDAVLTGSQDPTGGVDDELYYYNRLHRRMNGMNFTGDTLPDGSARTTTNLQALVNQKLLAAARAARAQDIVVYTIGLGNPSAAEHWKQPNARMLIEMANAPDGIDPQGGGIIVNPNYDPNQPEGGFFFAPEPSQLSYVFEQVARQIVLRLTQ